MVAGSQQIVLNAIVGEGPDCNVDVFDNGAPSDANPMVARFRVRQGWCDQKPGAGDITIDPFSNSGAMEYQTSKGDYGKLVQGGWLALDTTTCLLALCFDHACTLQEGRSSCSSMCMGLTTLCCTPAAGASGGSGSVTITSITPPCVDPQPVEVVDIQPVPNSLTQQGNAQAGSMQVTVYGENFSGSAQTITMSTEFAM